MASDYNRARAARSHIETAVESSLLGDRASTTIQDCDVRRHRSLVIGEGERAIMSWYMEWVTRVFAGVLVGVIGAGIGIAVAGILTPEIEEWAFQRLEFGIYGIAIGYSLGAPLGVLLAAFLRHRQGCTWLPFLICIIVLGVAYLLQDTVLFILLVGQPIFATLAYSIRSFPKVRASRPQQ